jgi:hypothetical protein
MKKAYPLVHIIAREEVLLPCYVHYRAAQLSHCRTQYKSTRSSLHIRFELLVLVKALAAFSNYNCAQAIDLFYRTRTTICGFLTITYRLVH